MVSNTPLSVLLMSVLVWGAVDSSLSQVSVDSSQEDVTAHQGAQHTDPRHSDHAIHLGNTQNIQTTNNFLSLLSTNQFDQEQD